MKINYQMLFYLLAITISSCNLEDEQFNANYCPELELNIGDYCRPQNLPAEPVHGIVNEDCHCEYVGNFDCLELQADFNDFCRDAAGRLGQINNDCECIIGNEDGSYDCLELEANFGDLCLDADERQGRLNEDCECMVNEPDTDYDCFGLQLNVGDACDRDANGNVLYVNYSCQCGD